MESTIQQNQMAPAAAALLPLVSYRADTQPEIPLRQAERGNVYVWWTLAVVLTLVLVFHFAMIANAVLPASPLTASYRKMAARYVYPFFAQNWNFFAPVPVNTTQSLVARVRYQDAQSGKSVETGWSDVALPLIDQVRRSRMSPLSLVQLGLSNVTNDYVNIIGNDLRSSSLDDKSQMRIIRSPIPATVAPSRVATLKRIALSSLAIQYPGQNFKEVQIAVLVRRFPRFAKRALPDSASENSLLSLDWQPAFAVPAFCCTPARAASAKEK